MQKVISQFTNVLKDRANLFLIFSQIFSAVIGIATGKLMAIFFFPEDYGKFNLQFATYFFFFSLLINPTIQFIKTKANILNKEGHKNFLKLISLFFFVTTFLVLIVFRIKFNERADILFVIILTLFFNLLFNIITDYFNVTRKIALFSWATILKNLSVFLILIALGFVVKYAKSDDVLEILWGVQLVGFLVGIIFFIKKYPLYFHLHEIPFKEYIKKYFKYSWPLLLLAFWSWMNSYFDRYIIEHYLQLKYVGLYNANLGLGSKVFLSINPLFLTILTPFVFNERVSIKEKKKNISKYANVYIILSSVILFILFIFHPIIGKILLSKLYAEGFFIIFWSSLAYFIITLGYLYELIFYANHKTKIILNANIISAIVNLSLNLILIKNYGLNGVVFSLVISAIIRFTYLRINFRSLK